MIDEAGNTPLRWLPEVASTCAGIGVLLVTVWQSKAQIDAIYQAQAGPVLTNHGSKVIFAGVSDVETLEYVSYLAGEEEVAATHRANADAHLAGYRRSVADIDHPPPPAPRRSPPPSHDPAKRCCSTAPSHPRTWSAADRGKTSASPR